MRWNAGCAVGTSRGDARSTSCLGSTWSPAQARRRQRRRRAERTCCSAAARFPGSRRAPSCARATRRRRRRGAATRCRRTRSAAPPHTTPSTRRAGSSRSVTRSAYSDKLATKIPNSAQSFHKFNETIGALGVSGGDSVRWVGRAFVAAAPQGQRARRLSPAAGARLQTQQHPRLFRQRRGSYQR